MFDDITMDVIYSKTSTTYKNYEIWENNYGKYVIAYKGRTVIQGKNGDKEFASIQKAKNWIDTNR
jgi:hypothetical protein